MKSNLKLVEDTDKFPYDDSGTRVLGEDVWTLLWQDDQGQYPIGYVLDRVIKELVKVPVSIRGAMELDEKRHNLLLFQLEEEEERSKAAAALTHHWRINETFKILRGWRDEMWPVYSRKGELLFSMERSAIGLLGMMRYGVHLTAYVADDKVPHGIKLWIPKRALNKSTFPGMLDNTVAGGLMTGESPFECIIREADEEASLPDDLVRRETRCVGTVTYIYVTEEKYVGEEGFIHPECQWVYDLELPSDVVPQPKDGEVDEFFLCSVDDVKRDLAEGRFKHNCALS
ncbi:hypothetical protein CDD81_1116 [Ophiocordyceps australis]|uniref:Nudix hydrolase domain-containing protein n=1 Tax=Ophiocordyceps australis TaxID=1399860 RepID=A0A2C5X875_9HYPO|nr:hypothetical protein CDD81_1116 [Ophiocordyceps australis]